MKRNKVFPIYIVVGSVCFGLGYLAGHWPKSEKFSPDSIMAKYKGGVVKAKEVDEVLRTEVELFKTHQAQARLKNTIEIVRQKILEIEAEKKHLSLPELVRQYQLAHQSDQVSDQELESYTLAQGLKAKTLSSQQRENFIKQIKNTRVIRAQEQLADELYKTYEVRLNSEIEPSATKD